MNTTAPKGPFTQRPPLQSLSEATLTNPFTAEATNLAPADAPEGTYTYALVASAPAVTAEELKVATDNLARRFSISRRGLGYQALSAALHLGLLGAASFFMPPLALASEDTLSQEQIEHLRAVLVTPAEREQEAAKGESAAASSGEKGSAANPGDRTPGAHAASGPKGPSRRAAEDADPHIRLHPGESREDVIQRELQGTVIGVLKAAEAERKTPAAWGDPSVLYADTPVPQRGMWSDTLGETNGSGALKLSDIGDGSGGPGDGYRVGPLSMFPPGVGRPGGGFVPRLRPGHTASGPRVRPGDTTVSSPRVPREVVQRIVRQNFGRFRLCYEHGLRQNAALAGRVSVRFVIGRDGSVGSVANGGSDLPDGGVVACVVRSFYGLSFPQPEGGGIVTVTYPISFAPGN